MSLCEKFKTWCPFVNPTYPTTCVQSLFLLCIRLYWGWQFAQTGWGKLTHIAARAANFKDFGIPFPEINVVLAGSTECFGGLLLLLGLCSRLVSIPLTFTMIVAYATAHREVLGTLWSKPDDFLGAPPFLFLLASLIILFFGPGKLSIDHLLGENHPLKKLASRCGLK